MKKKTKQQIVEENIIDVLNENNGEMPYQELKSKTAISEIERAITGVRFNKALNSLSTKLYRHRDISNAQARHKIVKLRTIEVTI